MVGWGVLFGRTIGFRDHRHGADGKLQKSDETGKER